MWCRQKGVDDVVMADSKFVAVLLLLLMMMMMMTLNALVTITIRLQFGCNSTALRPFDDLRYDRRLLQRGLTK